MDHARKFAVLLLIGIACTTINASPTKKDFKQCENKVKKWASSSLHLEVKEDSHILQDLLFFLHVPRTGGRTYFHCFLKKLYTLSLECPRSYDKLRFNPSKPDCRLLASHDDYSMMSKLPRDRTSVVTILRNPIDRIFSTYEFSVEVAARFLVHPNLTSATRMSGRIRASTKGVSTLDIWPWKYLVPWMREDLFARREARKLKDSAYTKSKDSYNMGDIVMPLLEYIHDPIALDIIHNGATFQVAGLTNNSNLGESHEVRHCVVKHPSLGEHVLEVAKKRLDNMLYVGLTEKHKESATMFANVVGSQVISQLMPSNSTTDLAANFKSVFWILARGYSHAQQIDSKSDTLTSKNRSPNQMPNKISSTHKVETSSKNMTVEKLTEVYETCISSLRNSQAQRRNMSLSRISPANFTKEARLHVPEPVLQEIASLNSLDMHLYNYAQDIFAKQHRKMVQKLDGSNKLQETQESKFRYPFVDAPSWKSFSLATIILLLFFLLLIVNARRRKSKLKI